MHSPPPDGPPARTLSVHRAFVVRLYEDVDFCGGSVGGQVEHVLSGEGGEFRSIEDLLRLMRRVLDAEPPPEAHRRQERER